MEKYTSLEIKRTFVEKPWGAEDWLFQTPYYVAKHLYINPNEEISLQYHNEKTETMMVLEGMGELTLIPPREDGVPARNVSKQTVTVGDIFTITPQTIHQIRAYTGLKILEVSTPQLEDLVRVGEDKYGRA